MQKEEKDLLIRVVRKRQCFDQFLHEITFTSLAEYLYSLQELTCNVLSQLDSRVMLYLAAAVSDFYIPREEMVSGSPTNVHCHRDAMLTQSFFLACISCWQQMHKIQSAKGPLSLSFHLVPKLLRPLVRYWCPKAFVISFKVMHRMFLHVTRNTFFLLPICSWKRTSQFCWKKHSTR